MPRYLTVLVAERELDGPQIADSATGRRDPGSSQMELFGGASVNAIVSHPMETSMKKLILASACALALAVGGAMAQTQPAPGASSEGNVGVSKHTTHMKHARHMKTTGQTTGMARSKQTTGQTTGMAPSKGTSASPSGAAKQPSTRY
jgi:hypothetical protein